MCGPMQLHNWGKSTDETERNYLYFNFTKTQYAGPEIHKMIIGIFSYIVDNYLTDFQLIDEAQYWETKDEPLMKENFRRNAALIQGFTEALRENTKREGEDVETYLADRRGGIIGDGDGLGSGNGMPLRVQRRLNIVLGRLRGGAKRVRKRAEDSRAENEKRPGFSMHRGPPLIMSVKDRSRSAGSAYGSIPCLS